MLENNCLYLTSHFSPEWVETGKTPKLRDCKLCCCLIQFNISQFITKLRWSFHGWLLSVPGYHVVTFLLGQSLQSLACSLLLLQVAALQSGLTPGDWGLMYAETGVITILQLRADEPSLQTEGWPPSCLQSSAGCRLLYAEAGVTILMLLRITVR